MNRKILIVEDEFAVANQLKLILHKANYIVCGIALSVSQAREIVNIEQPDIVLLDIHLKGPLNGIDLARGLQSGFIPFIYLSANSNLSVLEAAKETQPSGFLVKPFREKDLLIALEIAWYRHLHSSQSRLRGERMLLDSIACIPHDKGNIRQKFLRLAGILQTEMPFDLLAFVRRTKEEGFRESLSFLRIQFDEYQVLGDRELSTITGLSEADLLQIQQNSGAENVFAFYNNEQFLHLIRQSPMIRLLSATFRLRSNFRLPLLLSNGEVFLLSFFSRGADTYESRHLDCLMRIRPELEAVLSRIVSGIKEEEPLLSGEERAGSMVREKQECFAGIIGNSPRLLTVLDHVNRVAPADTSVLILGENGTGKEKIARAVHELSPRRMKPFVVVNGAALPAELIESELFGHEKGAFTGAHDKRVGKFEQASGGSIFLDEIGELSMQLQVKLLRVLQEREIERLGGNGPIKIDVRIIAATNRNLEEEVAGGRFRMDLYYRLNVFPIWLPPLRDRREDLHLLADHFIRLAAAKNHKTIEGISQEAMQELMDYHWPGNIRELENLIERSVILAGPGLIDRLHFPPSYVRTARAKETDGLKIKTIEETERDHIIEILNKSKYRIYGRGGAAEMLNMPPTTLAYKIKRLGIVMKTDS